MMDTKEWIKIIGKEKLQDFQDHFARLFNMGLIFYDLQNKPLTIASNGSMLCYTVRTKNSRNKKGCMDEHAISLKQTIEAKKGKIFTCSLGVSYFVCPVYWQGQLVAHARGGGIVYEDSPIAKVILEKFQVPVVSKEQFAEIYEFFSKTMGMLDLNCEVPENTDAAATFSVQDDRLSDRENEIVRLLCAGMNNKEISETLVISERTVKTHISHILTKLNMPDRVHVIIYYYKMHAVNNE